MDIEAEMRKLQAEARAQLEAESQANALPPTPISPEKRAAAVPEPEVETKEPSATDAIANTAALLNTASGALAAAQTAKEIASKVDPAVLKEAAELAEKGKKMSLGAKIGWGVVGLVGFLVAWEFILGPLVAALIAIAILVLLVAAILKVAGFFDKDKDGDEDESDADKKA